MAAQCTEHLPCRIVAHRGPLNARIEERRNPAGQAFIAVASDVGDLGSLGVKATKCHDGKFLVEVLAFGGGNALDSTWSKREDIEPALADLYAMARVVESNAHNLALSWRSALHG